MPRTGGQAILKQRKKDESAPKAKATPPTPKSKVAPKALAMDGKGNKGKKHDIKGKGDKSVKGSGKCKPHLVTTREEARAVLANQPIQFTGVVTSWRFDQVESSYEEENTGMAESGRGMVLEDGGYGNGDRQLRFRSDYRIAPGTKVFFEMSSNGRALNVRPQQ